MTHITHIKYLIQYVAPSGCFINIRPAPLPVSSFSPKVTCSGQGDGRQPDKQGRNGPRGENFRSLRMHPPLRISASATVLKGLRVKGSAALRSSEHIFSPPSALTSKPRCPSLSTHTLPHPHPRQPACLPPPFSLHPSQTPFFNLLQTPAPLSAEEPKLFVLGPRVYLHITSRSSQTPHFSHLRASNPSPNTLSRLNALTCVFRLFSAAASSHTPQASSSSGPLRLMAAEETKTTG